MEQSLIGKFKRVKWIDILHIFKFILAIPFAIILKVKRKDLWLLCDTQYEAADNAYWLFKYIRENEPNTDVCFAIDKNSNDYQKVASLGDVVHYGSFKHWVYYLAAERNVSSQKSGKPNAAVCYVLEVYGILKNKRIFLQHGVTTSNLTFLHYPHTKIKLFVTTTYDEWKYVNEVYGYPEGYVQELGFCRFDALHDFQVKKRQLLIMPTWRMYIRNEITSIDNETRMEGFKSTTYFKMWNGLLEDKNFIQFIKENKIDVVFYPHREMGAFIEAFDFSCEQVKVLSYKSNDVQTLLKESAFLITDFSSVSIDFAYMKKPLAYFHFDYEQYRAGHHPEGYFSYERDGFGPICTDVTQLVESLKKSYSTYDGFLNEDKYIGRHSKYFDLYDTDNCRRNYEAIAKL